MMHRMQFAVGLVFVLGFSAQTYGQQKPKVFVGYVFGRTDRIDFSLYTHLCHAFLTAEASGTLNPSRSVPDPDLVKRAHAAKVQVLISLGGWGWDEQFAAMGKDRAAEDRYVSAVLKMVDANDYDGLDLDWEYPDTREEVVSFERLARRLRKGLDAIGTTKKRPMLLTMAASSNAPTLTWLDTAFLVETMDWINVMTYDYTGPWTDYAGHHAPLHASRKQPGPPRSVEQTIQFLQKDRKVPADRIALGLPLYGTGFAVSEPYASTKNAPKKPLPQGEYSNLVRLRSQGWTRTWDDETSTPWLTAPDRSAVIGYDDERSLSLKTDYALSQGLRGVFFWQINGDLLPDGTHPLQSAARKRFDAARPK